ncbi:MAG: protein kinase domain-containing protein [Chloroflexia bacterium]
MPIPSTFDPTSLLGQNIGGNLLKEVVGMSNAVVYRAVRESNGEDVAFKLLAWPGGEVDAKALRRFKREIETLREARHKAIIDIYDWHPDGPYIYLVMEYCEGTLGEWMRTQRGQLRLNDILTIAELVAGALDCLHESTSPIVHHDIKPANILHKGRNWYIADFGIARPEADASGSDSQWPLTPQYAAPEQLNHGRVSAKADIYCFGLVVYEMLAGGWVLGERNTDWAYDIPPLSTYRSDLPAGVDELFRRWLAAEPTSRPSRALDAVRELAACAGILSEPALSRLYEMAAKIAAGPRSAAEWGLAAELLNAIRLDEPSFSDPLGLGAILSSLGEVTGGKATTGRQQAGYTGEHPAGFYSDKTTAAPALVEAGEPDAAEARKLRPPSEGGGLFAPRSRANAGSTLVVPANSRWEGAIFGRNIVVERGARVEGAVYSLGGLTLGEGSVVDGAVIAGGRIEAGAESRFTDAGGVHGGSIELGQGARVAGVVSASGGCSAAPGVEAGGLLAEGPVSVHGGARFGAASIGSATGKVETESAVSLGGVYAGGESVHAWTPGGGQAMGAGHVLTSLLTRRARAQAEAAVRTADRPAALATPNRAVEAGTPSLEAATGAVGLARYLVAALRPDPDAPPDGLPSEGWEGPLAGAWMLDQAWREFVRGLRVPGVCAGLLTVFCWGGAAWLAGRAPQAAGGMLLVWVGVILTAGGLLWALRPQPLELVRLWWAWETWSMGGGAVVWDTLDPGRGRSGWVEPDAPLSPLTKGAERLSEAGATDAELLGRLTELGGALEAMAWQGRPGLFAGREEAAALEIARLELETPEAEALRELPVLASRFDAGDVRAWAGRLASWPAYQAEAREVLRGIESHLKAFDPALARWKQTAQEVAARNEAAIAARAAAGERAAAVAAEGLGLLDEEAAPYLDRVWDLRLKGDKKLSAYYEHARETLAAADKLAAGRAGNHEVVTERELGRQKQALAEIRAEIEKLGQQWQELGEAHDQVGADLRRAWKDARSRAAQTNKVGNISVIPLPTAPEQALRRLPQIALDAKNLDARADELLRERLKDEQELPTELVWPEWPQRLDMPLEVHEAGYIGLLRRLADEPRRVSRCSEKLDKLQSDVKRMREIAEGAARALAEAQAAAGGAAADQQTSAKAEADALAAHLTKRARELELLQGRLGYARNAYRDVMDMLDTALRGGRGPTWAEGRLCGQRYTKLAADWETTAPRVERAKEMHDAAQQEVERIREEGEAAQKRLAQAEEDLLAYSRMYAENEAAALCLPTEQLRAIHKATAASMAEHAGRLTALAAFERDCSDLKIRAGDGLRERIRGLAGLASGRIDETIDARAAALWPSDAWPASDTCYLLPVWMLRYRPVGRRQATRLLAVTPGSVRARVKRGGIGGSFALISGFEIVPLPGLAAGFEADLLTEMERRLTLTPLLGENLAPDLAERWKPLVERGLVSGWLARLV